MKDLITTMGSLLILSIFVMQFCTNQIIASKILIADSIADKIEKFDFKSLDEYKTVIQKQAKEIGNCKIIKFITIVLTIIYSASMTQIPHMQIFSYSNVIAYLLSGFMLLLLFYFNFKTNKKAKENRENIELFCLVQMVNKTKAVAI